MGVTVARGDPGASGRAVAAARRLDALAIAVAALTLAAFALRLSQIHQSLFGDELWTYQQVTRPTLAGVLHAIRPPAENAPPLFFLLAWLSAKLGDPTVLIRLPSLILGVATLPVVYALGRETVGRTAGLIAAAVLAASPFSIYYGLEARPYATTAFFVALSTFAVVKATRSGALRWWALYGLSAAAAAYSHYTAIFALAVQAAWSLWTSRDDGLKRSLIANACVVALYLPWLPHVSSRGLSIIGGLESMTVHNVLVDLARVIPGYPYASLHAIPTLPGLAVVGACAVAGIVALVKPAAGRLRGSPTDGRGQVGELGLICALAAATPVGVGLYSLLGTDIWDARDLYASVPAFALVLGAALAALTFRLRLLAVALVLATLLAATVRAVGPSYARPPFRAAASYLDRVAGASDPIILYPSFLRLDDVIPIEFRRRHVVVEGVPGRWPTTPPAGSAFVVFDDRTETALRIPVPRPRGYVVTARRQYGGLVPFTLLIYRRVGS